MIKNRRRMDCKEGEMAGLSVWIEVHDSEQKKGKKQVTGWTFGCLLGGAREVALGSQSECEKASTSDAGRSASTSRVAFRELAFLRRSFDGAACA